MTKKTDSESAAAEAEQPVPPARDAALAVPAAAFAELLTAARAAATEGSALEAALQPFAQER